MIFLPVIPLLLGAVFVWVARRRHERVFWGVTVGVALASWLLVLGLEPSTPREQIIPFGPSAGGGAELLFALDGPGWAFTYLSTTLLCAIALTGVVRTGAGTASARAMMLAFTALALVAMMAANFLAVVLTWALMDGAFFALGRRPAVESDNVQDFVTRLLLDALGVLLAAAAAVLGWAGGAGGGLLGERTPPAAVVLLALAGLLRLGLLPPHFSLPALPGVRRGIGTLLRFLPAATVLCALARALRGGVPSQALPWLWVAGTLGILVGGVQWIAAADPIEGRRFFVVTVCSVGVLGAAAAPRSAEVVLVAAGASLLLGGAVLSVTELHARWQRTWPAAAALILAGLPMTPGGLAMSRVAARLLEGEVLGVVLVVVGMAFCAYGMLRIATTELAPWPVAEGLARLSFALGMGLPVVVGIGIGLSQGWTFTVPGLIGFVVTSLCAAGLFWITRRIPARRIDRARRVAGMLDPAPAYRVLGKASAAVGGVVRGLTNVLEGQGAMLWTIVVVLLAWLAAR